MWDGAKNGRASIRVRISKIMFSRKYMYMYISVQNKKKILLHIVSQLKKLITYSNDPHICKPLICKHTCSLYDKYGFTIC